MGSCYRRADAVVTRVGHVSNRLESLDLEHNRLDDKVTCPFNQLARLRVLRLRGNGLLSIPPLAGAHRLRELSIANLTITGGGRIPSKNGASAPTPGASKGGERGEGRKGGGEVLVSFHQAGTSLQSSLLSPLKTAVSYGSGGKLVWLRMC